MAESLFNVQPEQSAGHVMDSRLANLYVRKSQQVRQARRLEQEHWTVTVSQEVVRKTVCKLRVINGHTLNALSRSAVAKA